MGQWQILAILQWKDFLDILQWKDFLGNIILAVGHWLDGIYWIYYNENIFGKYNISTSRTVEQWHILDILQWKDFLENIILAVGQWDSGIYCRREWFMEAKDFHRSSALQCLSTYCIDSHLFLINGKCIILDQFGLLKDSE